MALFGQTKAEDVTALIAKKNYTKAIEVIREQLATKKNDPRVKMQLGDVLVMAGKGGQAIPIYLSLADEFAKEGFAAKAISVLKKIQKIDPARRDVDARLASLIQEKQRHATVAAPSPAGGGFEIGIEEIGMEPPPGGAGSAPAFGGGAEMGMEAGGVELGMDVPAAEPEPPPPPPPPPPKPRPAAPPKPAPPKPAPPPPPKPAPVVDQDLFIEGETEALSLEPEPEPAPPAAEAEPLVLEPEPEPEPAALSLETEPLQLEPEATRVEPEIVSPEPEPQAAEPEIVLEAQPEPEPVADPMSDTAFADELLSVIENAFPGDGGEVPFTQDIGAPEDAAGGAQIVVSPLFKDFSVDEMVAVIQGLNLITFDQGAIILTQGDPGDALYMLTSGKVKCFKKNAQGRQVLLGELDEGAFFGEVSILTGQPRTATVVAATYCELLELDRATLDGITKTHPHVRQVLQEFCDQRLKKKA